MTTMSVYYKLHRARFFHSSAYALANLAVQSLYVLMDALVFGTIVYWCSGFTSSNGSAHYWMFLLATFMTGSAMGLFFRSLVSSPDFCPS